MRVLDLRRALVRLALRLSPRARRIERRRAQAGYSAEFWRGARRLDL